MSNPLQLLEEMKERLGDLPQRVLDQLQQFQAEKPQPAATSGPSFPAQPESSLKPMPATAMAASELPSPARFEPMEQSKLPFVAPFTPPARSASTSSTPSPLVPLAAAVSSSSNSPVPAGGGIINPPLSSYGGGNDDEVLGLLRQLHEKMLGGRGRESRIRPGRTPPPANNAVWSNVWTPLQEGYAAASPSMDVSNMAGAGGASATRGFATNPRNNRYLQPDTEIPR